MMYVSVCTFTEERNVQVMTQVDVRRKHQVLALTFHFEGLLVCLCRSQANRPMNFLGILLSVSSSHLTLKALGLQKCDTTSSFS